MNIAHVVILSIIEGLTEFLPVSSTGHLILASHLLGIKSDTFVTSFEIIIQLGAILAVVVLYFDKVKNSRTLWKTLLFAFIPSGVIGFVLYKVVKQYLLGNDIIVVVSLILGGVILLFIDALTLKNEEKKAGLSEITPSQAIKIGIAQSLAIIPGVSRSASTIIGAQIVGVTRKAAVEFSFLLAVPTMLAATVFDLSTVGSSFTQTQFIYIAIGFVLSFVTALIAVKTFVSYVQDHGFRIFGIYRIAVGVLYAVIKVLQ